MPAFDSLQERDPRPSLKNPIRSSFGPKSGRARRLCHIVLLTVSWVSAAGRTPWGKHPHAESRALPSPRCCKGVWASEDASTSAPTQRAGGDRILGLSSSHPKPSSCCCGEPWGKLFSTDPCVPLSKLINRPLELRQGSRMQLNSKKNVVRIKIVSHRELTGKPENAAFFASRSL